MTINERFIESVNYLLKVKSVKSKTDLAQNLKIGRTTLSEILNKRMNIGIETVAHYCLLYEIRLEWLLNGKGKMIREGEFVPKSPELYDIYLENVHLEPKLTEKNIDYKELADVRKEFIELQKEKIKNLENQIFELKKQKESSIHTQMVAKPTTKLEVKHKK